jgi:hypothetical protein
MTEGYFDKGYEVLNNMGALVGFIALFVIASITKEPTIAYVFKCCLIFLSVLLFALASYINSNNIDYGDIVSHISQMKLDQLQVDSVPSILINFITFSCFILIANFTQKFIQNNKQKHKRNDEVINYNNGFTKAIILSALLYCLYQSTSYIPISSFETKLIIIPIYVALSASLLDKIIQIIYKNTSILSKGSFVVYLTFLEWLSQMIPIFSISRKKNKRDEYDFAIQWFNAHVYVSFIGLSNFVRVLVS